MAEVMCPITSRFVVCMMFVQREKCPSPPGSAVEQDGLRAVPGVAYGLHHNQHDPDFLEDFEAGPQGRTAWYAGRCLRVSDPYGTQNIKCRVDTNCAITVRKV